MTWHPYVPLHFIEMIFPLVIIGMDVVPSIIDVWGDDREFCSSSSSTRTSQKPYNIESGNFVIRYISIIPKRL